MRTWFWTLLLLTAAVVIAVGLRENTGHVLILVNDWRVQISLAFAVVALMALFFLLHWLLGLSSWLTGIPGRVRDWSDQRQVRREQALLEQGWTELLEGRYSHAEKDLTKLFGRSKNSSRQVLAALSAARAAHALGEFDRRDHLISLAKEKMPADGSLKEAIATAAADLYLDQGLATQALTELMPLQTGGARHVHTLRLLLRAYRQLNQHEEVFTLARTLNRRGALPDAEARPVIEGAAAARLRETTQSKEWQSVWKGLKAGERTLPEVALAGAAAMEANGHLDEGARALEDAIIVSFDPRLLAFYARTEPSQVSRRLQKAETWVKARPEDANLLATVGNLCLVGQLWGQAENYLSRSLAKRSDARVHALLGSLYDKMARPTEAAAQWRMATAVTAALPVWVASESLPAADTAADPGVLHAEGLAYLPESDLTGDDVYREATTINAPKQGNGTNENMDEYFDSAPVTDLGEPAPVITLAPEPGKKQ